VVKRLGRGVLRGLGLRPPDYKASVRHGEVCMDNIELHGLVRAIDLLARPPETVVEIGSYCGGSTVVIARAARRRNPAVRVYAIEPFTFHESRYQHDYERLFDANVAEWGLGDSIVKVRATSHEAVRDWKRPVDFLYVDGDHRYEAVARDIDDYLPFLTPEGLVAFHDYKPRGKEGVKRAIDERVVPRYERVFLMGSLVCFRKAR
jgi:predicted O-methyltransferase YrrM